MEYLIVDDERLALKDTERMLRRVIAEDDDIYTADNYSSALALVREKPIHVAFLDIDMPDMNGLELAKRMLKLKQDINIIFLTAFEEYSLEAWKIFASGFLLKPVCSEDIQNVLKHLRNPMDEESDKVVIQCFGNFECFFHGKLIKFERTKSKEFLAFLIDRKGAMVTENELRMVLWEEDLDTVAKSSYIRSIASDIRKTFDNIGIKDILIHGRGKYAIDTKYISCDYLKYLEGDEKMERKFHGEYMTQYSWAEETLGLLIDNKK